MKHIVCMKMTVSMRSVQFYILSCVTGGASLTLKAESERLLEIAKYAVEIAIEADEQLAMVHTLMIKLDYKPRRFILMLKRGLHSPAHLYVDNAAYFITSAIHQKRPLLKLDPIKHHLLASIEACFYEKIGSWIIGLF